MANLRALSTISAWPGLLHCGVRMPLQLALWAMAWHAWQIERYGLFFCLTLVAALFFASLMSLSHDALHHRLTGIAWLDEVLGCAISWPIAWPIASYKYAHLLHHRLSGSDLKDPERISPLTADWNHSASRRMVLRHQLWFAMFVAGAAGLAYKLLKSTIPRWKDPAVRSALVRDAIGIAVTLGTLTVLAYQAQGGHGVLGFAIAWLVHERVVGVAHQFRNHMEHYGLWGAQGGFIDTQYASARSIQTNTFGRLYFNMLNRHADHHVAPAIPFYRLEEAHALIEEAYQREGFSSLQTQGYWGALREVLVAMKASYAADGLQPQRLQASHTLVD